MTAMSSMPRQMRQWALVIPMIAVLSLPHVTRAAESDDSVAAPRPPDVGIATGGGLGPDYRLTPRDLVQVEMFNRSEIETTQRLTAAGEVRLPLVGRVVLQGLTVREAEQQVEKLYRDGGYFMDPQIIISVSQYSERNVAVLGQVRNPDRIPLPPEANSIGILEAITLAGGLTRIAKADAVQVTRTEKDGSTKRFEVNVQQLLSARRSEEKREFQLQPGDVVFVPEKII